MKGGPVRLHITPGPQKVLAEHDIGDKWCFGCRKRLPHTVRVLGDEEPSYYEPVAVRVCSGCGRDQTAFPQ